MLSRPEGTPDDYSQPCSMILLRPFRARIFYPYIPVVALRFTTG